MPRAKRAKAAPAGLTEAEELEYLELMEAEYGGQSLDAFWRQHFPLEPPPDHWRELIALLERARTEPMSIIVEAPPRHAKSEAIKRALTWKLQRDPALLSAYIAYGAEQAEEPSRRMREIARLVGLELAEDSQAVNYWHTPQNGGLAATGINGPLTGKGIGGWLVVDDPYKDRREAESGLKRERVWEWLRSTAFSRLEGIASVIVIMQRWHVDDVVGRLKKGGLPGRKWHVVSLPALTDVRTGLGAADDCPDEFLRALWPARPEFGVEAMKAKRLELGPYYWHSQYMQDPRIAGQALFREPGRYDRRDFKIDGCRLIWGVDPAGTAKTSSDHSAAVLMAVRGYGTDAVAYILDVVRIREEVSAFTRRVAALAKQHNTSVVVEAVGGFVMVPQTLKEIAPGLDVRIAEIKGQDKFQRAQSIAAAWNDRRVLLPMEAPWLEEYMDEFRSFTGIEDAYDDQVDATAHAWNALYGQMPAAHNYEVY